MSRTRQEESPPDEKLDGGGEAELRQRKRDRNIPHPNT